MKTLKRLLDYMKGRLESHAVLVAHENVRISRNGGKLEVTISSKM